MLLQESKGMINIALYRLVWGSSKLSFLSQIMDNPTEEIKSRLDITEVIGEYIKLTKSGTNHKAPCPFHKEKTPSFMVSQEKQIFHCFGCNEGGDAFTFVQKIENCDFPEALRILAKKANVELKPRNPQLYSEKTKVLDALKMAAKFYQRSFEESKEGEIARKYLKERKLTQETIEDYSIGYAPETWDAVYNFLKKRDFDDQIIFKTGLVGQKATGADRYYDRFRRRLMFPIKDVHGQVVGFTGRVLPGGDEEKEGGKYVNTPQTVVYNKSCILYNLDIAKAHIKKADYTILVEGQMDAVALWQEGIRNVVCVSGTALTEQQVNLLKRYSPNIILSFDMDEGGERALERGIGQALANEMNVKVLTLPYGKDPDECVKEKGKQVFLGAVKDSQIFMEYLFDKAFNKFDKASAQGKKQIVRFLLPWIKSFASPVEQDHYRKDLADKIGIEISTINDEFRKTKPIVEGVALATETPISEERAIPETRYEKLSQRVLALSLDNKNGFGLGDLTNILEPEFLVGQEIQELYKKLIVYYTKNEQINLDEVLHDLNDQPKLKDRLNAILLLAEEGKVNLSSGEIEKEVLEGVKLLEKNHLEERIKQIEQELGESERAQDSNKIKELSEEFSSLVQKLKDLN